MTSRERETAQKKIDTLTEKISTLEEEKKTLLEKLEKDSMERILESAKKRGITLEDILKIVSEENVTEAKVVKIPEKPTELTLNTPVNEEENLEEDIK
jgi:hypothetical protein